MVQFAAIIGVVVWAKHHANIRRLRRGEAPRIGSKSKA
jgi:acyl phosphate:glycerol-3-phosphate acyltransferase